MASEVDDDDDVATPEPPATSPIAQSPIWAPSLAETHFQPSASLMQLAPEPSPAEYAEALGAGLARGGTLGLSDPLLIAAGIRSQKLKELQEKAPLTSDLSEFAGGMAPALLTGGESLAGKVAGQAALGAAMGAGHEISEEALGDKEFAAESILAAGLMGGLVGGGTGALLLGVELGAPKILDRISNSTQALGEKLHGFAEKYGGQDARANLEKGVGDLTDGLQKVADDQAYAGRQFHGNDQDGLRYQEQDSLLANIPHGQVLPDARQAILDAKSQLNQMGNEVVPAESVKHIDNIINKLGREVDNSSDASDLMSSFREARRHMRDVSGALEDSGLYGKEQAKGYVDSIDSVLKSHIEDTGVYGAAGAREASVNTAIAKEIDATDELIRNGLAKRAPGRYEAANISFKPAAIRGLARDMVAGRPEAQAKLEAIENWVQSIKDSGGELNKSAGSLPGSKAGDDIKQIVMRQAKNLAEMQGKTEAVKSLQEAIQNAKPSSFLGGASHLGSLGAVGGMISGHPLGALGGLVLKGVANPGAALSTLASISRAASKTSSFIARNIGDFMNSNVARAGALDIADTIKGQSWSGKRQNSIEDRAEAHSERKDQILNLASNPENLHSLIVNKTGALSDAAPGIAGIAAMKIATGVSHLAGKLPPHGSPADLLPHLDAHHPSHAEIDNLERSHRVVTKPLSVLKSMKTGSLTSDEVNTLKTVYPKLYDRMATQMMEKLAALSEPLPYANRLQVATFLGKPADSSLVPQNLAMLQGNYQISQPQPGPSKPMRNSNKVSEMKTAEAARTPFQRVAGEA